MSGWSETSIANPARSGSSAARRRTNGWSLRSTTWSSPITSASGAGRAAASSRAARTLSPRNVGAYRTTRRPVGDPVAAAHVRRDPGPPRGVGEQVGARDADPGREPVERQPERLRVVGGDRRRRHEAQVVVGMDRDPFDERLVGAEGPVEHAVAELLERAGGVPDLDPDRPRPRVDHVQREEVVVDDERPRRGEVVAGRMACQRAATRPRTPGRWRNARTTTGSAGARRASSSRMKARLPPRRSACEVARTTRRRIGRMPAGGEPGPDGQGPQRDDETLHRERIRSMTRSVEPPSRWSKWRAANGATFSSS